MSLIYLLLASVINGDWILSGNDDPDLSTLISLFNFDISLSNDDAIYLQTTTKKPCKTFHEMPLYLLFNINDNSNEESYILDIFQQNQISSNTYRFSMRTDTLNGKTITSIKESWNINPNIYLCSGILNIFVLPQCVPILNTDFIPTKSVIMESYKNTYNNIKIYIRQYC